ncbi:MAG TPA: threonine--tRNA ligase [Syntrophomonadaceae bacterium]|nr:threonine--tRNA ligase [Syntrophomonadaceae bacterium]
MVSITLKDGKAIQVEPGKTVLELVDSISKKLAKNAVAAVYNGELVGLTQPLNSDGELEILTFEDERAREVYRHSSAHVLAQAVQRLWPNTKLAIGPAIDKGFYYDFDTDHTFSPEDFALIEEEMKKIIKSDYEIKRKEISRSEALQLFTEMNEPYKVELIEDLPEDAVISVYEQGEFIDLCAGPHLPSTGQIKAVKCMSVAGAYWRGNEKNKMLQRLYATSFPKKSMLDDYLNKIEEAKKRDHRKLGKELGLFALLDEGPGFPFFLPKGMVLRNQLEKYWREEHEKAGYMEISTPIMLNRELWEQSGHWDHYRENMYFTKIDEEDFAVKPMNCPGGILVYKQDLHSYRDLPLRIGEMGLVHRHEKSGVLHGLMRVRAFTQDDAHIFMLPEQIIDEIEGVIDLIDRVYSRFGFNYFVELSTRPEDSMGSQEMWDRATEALITALERKGMQYTVNEGDGAFYGPKIDFHLQDSLDRTWQCGTIQLDFQMPEKFDLVYIGEDGEKHRPVMIHRVIFGSMERFIGIITEHFAGAFPTWLAPVQVRLLPITDRHHAYADDLMQKLKAAGVRVEVDKRNEKVGYKIREGQLQKIPYLLIVGDKEIEQGAVAVRHRKDGDLGSIAFNEFKEKITAEIASRDM